MSEHFFVCSIGPVQGFIAAARSSRDLTYGSWLLSELAKTAARTVAEREGKEALVFPAPDADLAPGSETSVANKVVAVVKGEPNDLAQAIQEALNRYLMDAWGQVEEKVGEIDVDLARQQIKDLLEFYWVAAPLLSSEDYEEVRNLCEEALKARKVTRDFTQRTGKSRFKSTIDGVHEHVLRLGSDRKDAPTEKQMQRYRLRNGELLSGVDLLKRWGEWPKARTYKSVSHIAALPFIEGLGDEKAKRLHQALVQMFTKHEAPSFVDDFSVLYPSEVRAAFKERERVQQILQEQERILTQHAGQRRPGPYYALLLGDGDYMGKTIDAQNTVEKHQALSRALREFAKQVPSIIEKHRGVPIYSGGDDVLAYLPLHTALVCVRELADAFAQQMKDFAFEEDGMKRLPTFSAGLVIVHHLEPLSEVLDLARRTEKAAKSVPGKNALAITLSKRSGSERQIRGNLSELIERLQKMISWWQAKVLSKGTPYELEKLAHMESVLEPEALQAEAIRILKRKRESGGEREIPQKILEQFRQYLTNDDEKSVGLHELTQEMMIAAELAAAEAQAQGKEG